MVKVAGNPDVVVIGASAGGVEALRTLVARLPCDFGAALLVVQHIGARRSRLPEILARAGPLPVVWAANGQSLQPGCVYVAPPDRHLLISPGGTSLALSRGPSENHTRPAVDPLFRSAAQACGSRVIGIVLSGALGDGTAGLAEIVRLGGTTVVQDPDEAEYPDMPRSALRHVPVHHCLPVARIAELLIGLCGTEHASAAASPGEGDRGSLPHVEEEDVNMEGEHTLKRPTALTCPTCGGAVAQSSVDSLPYFECHTGHRFAAQNMDDAQFQQLEGALEVALRVLNERTELTRRLADAARGKGQTLSAGRWDAATREAMERARIMRRFVEQGWERPADIGDDGDLAGLPGGG